MSSLIRRLEIRIMKRGKYTREKFIGVRDPITGERKIREVLRGGEITDPDDNPIGRRWPIRIPARIASKAKPHKRIARPPRGSRRGKPSAKWIAARADRKARA